MTKAPCCRRLKLLKLLSTPQQGHAGEESIESSPRKDKMMSDRRARRTAMSPRLKQVLAAKRKAKEAHSKCQEGVRLFWLGAEHVRQWREAHGGQLITSFRAFLAANCWHDVSIGRKSIRCGACAPRESERRCPVRLTASGFASYHCPICGGIARVATGLEAFPLRFDLETCGGLMNDARFAKKIIRTLEHGGFYAERPCCEEPVRLRDCDLLAFPKFTKTMR
jgi:hypothetical protein